MSDAAAVIAKIRTSRPETTVVLHLDGKLYGEWKDAERGLRELPRSDRSNSLAGDPGAIALAKRVSELEEQIRSSRVTVRLRGLGRRWSGYVVKHPPRDEHPQDKDVGANVDNLFNEVMPISMVELKTADGDVVEMPVTEVDGTLTQAELELYDVITADLSDAQWSELCSNVLALNSGSLGVPFSLAASKINQNSGGDSNKQSDSASPTSVSKGGSRRKSSSTSTTTKAD